MTGKDLTTGNFDDSGLPEDVKGKLLNLQYEIKKAIKRSVEDIFRIADACIEAQSLLAKHGGDGRFGKWIDSSIPVCRSTVYDWMRARQEWGDCRATLQMEPTAVITLGNSGVPKQAKNEAVKLADKGVNVTTKVAKELIAKYSKPAASKDAHAQDRHATAATETGTDTRGGSLPAADDPDSCLDSGLPHKWISDGNGDRYCEVCKVDHPDNDVRPDPKEVAVKHLTGIAATLVQARINFHAVCQDLGTRPATYDQIMADADKALVSIRRWAKELVA